MEWLEKIRRRAEQEGLDADELTDTLLHRTFCLQRPKFDEELGVSVEQIKGCSRSGINDFRGKRGAVTGMGPELPLEGPCQAKSPFLA